MQLRLGHKYKGIPLLANLASLTYSYNQNYMYIQFLHCHIAYYCCTALLVPYMLYLLQGFCGGFTQY